MAESRETTVVVPAFNEGAAIERVVRELGEVGPWHEVLVVDDGSTDDTAAHARAAGARVIRHPYNKGNGAAVKSGIRTASGAYLLVIDGDGQHRAADAPRLLAPLDDYDLVVGARHASTHATLGRRLGNAVLNRLATYLTAHPVPDLTSGFRAARTRPLKEFLHLIPNGFSTPTTTTLAFIKAGYSVTFVPTAARPRRGQSKIRFVQDGFKFFLILLRVITIYSPLRVFVPLSLASLTGGVGYALWTTINYSRVTNTSVLLTVLGVLIFLIGLVSEQISTLRTEPRERD